MTVLNERIAGLDDRFVEIRREMDEIREAVQGVDSTEIDELKEKLSSAIGEATLVRIEMERLEKGINEKSDGLAIRVTEVETQLADATMDVSTAVQLDRLEEIERALIELDPAKFVLKDGAEINTGASGPSLAPPAAPSLGAVPPIVEETVKNAPAGADENSGVDIAAIIANAEGVGTSDSDHT